MRAVLSAPNFGSAGVSVAVAEFLASEMDVKTESEAGRQLN
jgi:hypothetical protein